MSLTQTQQKRIEICGTILPQTLSGSVTFITYTCDNWRECERCLKHRIEGEKNALTLYFRHNPEKPILARTFIGLDAEDRASLFCLRLHRRGQVYRRYPGQGCVVILHDCPLDTLAEDLTFSEMLRRVEQWVMVPVGKNMSGKLGYRAHKKEHNQGEAVYELAWQSDAPTPIEEAAFKDSMEHAKAEAPDWQESAVGYNCMVALFESRFTEAIYSQGYCLNFSFHVKRYRVFTTEKTDNPIAASPQQAVKEVTQKEINYEHC